MRKPRPPPVRKPRPVSKTTLKRIQKQSSGIANNVVQQALNALKTIRPGKPILPKPRPAPVRRPKKVTQRTLKGIQKQSSNIANNVVQQALNALKTIKNTTMGPHHQYGLLSGSRNSPEESRPKPRKPRKPARKPSFVANVGNPYAINMVMDESKPQASRSKSKPRSKPRSKSRSVSLNNAGPARAPERTLSFNQLAPPLNVNQEMRKAQSQANFFKTAIQRRKAASKSRSAKGKAI